MVETSKNFQSRKCTFFLWGFVISRVYAEKPQIIPELKSEIQQDIENLNKGAIWRIFNSILNRNMSPLQYNKKTKLERVLQYVFIFKNEKCSFTKTPFILYYTFHWGNFLTGIIIISGNLHMPVWSQTNGTKGITN